MHSAIYVFDCMVMFSAGFGDSGRFKNKTDFPTLTRMAYCQCRLRKVLGSVFAQFNWSTIVIISDLEDEFAKILGETLEVGLKIGGLLPFIKNYYGKSQPNYAYEVLNDVRQVSRGKVTLRDNIQLQPLEMFGCTLHEPAPERKHP